jgi:hypothetical protein
MGLGCGVGSRDGSAADCGGFAGELAVADQLVGQASWGRHDLHEPLPFRVIGFLGDVAEDDQPPRDRDRAG